MDILENIWTIDQVNELIQTVDTLNNSLYTKGKQSWSEVLLTRVGTDTAKYFDISEEKRKAYLDEVRQKIKEVAVLRLSVAVELPTASIQQICLWARQNISPVIVLDLAVDRSLIAGAQISFSGKYVDLSAKTDLEKLLEKYGRL
ncbi:MAG: F0F1 ATP synthase subunit delta [bacterium]|nr:F0F1 ATP synthase subunit delta [bacterium]